MGITVDSNFIIDMIKSDPGAPAKTRELDERREVKLLSDPVLYEVSSGLLYTRSRSEAAAFQTLTSGFVIQPFDQASALKAAEMRAELLRLGRTKDHVDIMIGGIAAAGGHALVTRDRDLQALSQAVGLRIEGN